MRLRSHWGWSLLLAAGCGENELGRAPSVDAVVPLGGAALLVAEGGGEVLVLSTPDGATLDRAHVDLGRTLASARAADGSYWAALVTDDVSDGSTLVVVDDPALTDGVVTPRRIPVSAQYGALQLDPTGRWALLSAPRGLIVNDAEFALVDLEAAEPIPVVRELSTDSASTPTYAFSPELELPTGGTARYLVATFRGELRLLELDAIADGDPDELDVPLSRTDSGGDAVAVALAFDAGSDERPARLAVALDDSADVQVITFIDSDGEVDLFPNLVDVGGEASAVEFFETPRGFRGGALVDDALELVDPDQGTRETVALGGTFTAMHRLSAGGREEVLFTALGRSAVVAFWDPTSASTGRRRVETRTLATVQSTVEVIESGGRELAFLTGPGGRLFVGDSEDRSVSTFTIGSSSFGLVTAPSGDRLWLAPTSGAALARLELPSLETSALELPVQPRAAIELRQTRGAGSSVLALDYDYGGVTAALVAPDATSVDSAIYFPMVWFQERLAAHLEDE